MTTTTQHPQEHATTDDPRPAEVGRQIPDEAAAEEVAVKLFQLWTAAHYILGGRYDLDPFLHSPADARGFSLNENGRDALRRLRDHLAAGLEEVGDLAELYTSKRDPSTTLGRHEDRLTLVISAIHGILDGGAGERVDHSVLIYALSGAIREARESVARHSADNEEEA